MDLIQSKSLLAKLMATENLTVEQRNVTTASFDVKNRILTVPILDKKISSFLYDLFLGHEVGHALFTPLDGLYRARELKLPASVMNVLEDSRIERKVKNKYPGIRSSFVRAYRELIEKDFFGTAGINLNEMNFIDRVNLYTKGGASQGIKFNDFEKSLVERIENTQSYEDVIEVGHDVVKYMKAQEEERKLLMPELDEEDQDEDEDYELFDSEGYEDSDLEDGTEERKSKNLGKNDKDGEKEESEGDNSPNESMDKLNDERDGGESPSGTDPEGVNEDSTKSFTDEAYRKNESKLFANDNKVYYYGNIPDVDLNKRVITYKKLWRRYQEDIAAVGSRWNNIGANIDTELFIKLRNDAKKVVGYLAKEFELRKNADQMKRASVSKTGELNMSKIYSYGFSEDIFKKITVVPNGKSHGLVMFLDWSGSMSNHLNNTLKQLINLVMFCKKVNIPYEVYAFTSEYNDDTKVDVFKSGFKIGDLALQNFNLLNLLSSKMSASEFTYACSALVHIVTPRAYRPNWLQQGGTPLTEAIISAMKIVPEFQKDYKLQIVNTVFLTDGEGHSIRSVYCNDSYGNPNTGYNNSELDGSGFHRRDKVLVIRDPITKNQEIVEQSYSRNLTAAYIKLLKARTNCNVVGFYVLSGREFGRESHNFFPSSVDHQKLKAEFRKDKYKVVTSAGYDEYYLLRAEGLDTDEDVEFQVKENATTRGLVNAFSKYAGNRLSNRVVLNRFVGMIS